MSHLENKFKTASVGGFVKREVVSYIESMEMEYRTKLGTLEKIVAATQASRSELERRLQELESGRGQDNTEAERLKTLVGSLQERLNEKEAELQNALEEVERLQASQQAASVLQMQLLEVTRESEEMRIREAELLRQLAQQDSGASEAAQAEIARLQAELERQRELVLALQQENTELRLELEKRSESAQGSTVSTALLLELQTQLDQRNRQLISMNEDLELMREKCRNYEDTVGAFQEAQAKADQIEMEAREKAIAMMAAASEESDKLKSDLDTWLSEIEESYQRVKKDAEQKVARAHQELEKTKAAMAQLSGARAEQGEALPQRPTFSVIPGYGDAKNA